MPYTTIPTVLDGNALPASHLNLLRNNILFLNGIASGANVPFPSTIYTNNWGISDARWRMRHIGQYLHWQARLTLTDIDDFQVWVNGTMVFQDLVQRAAPFTYAGFVDLAVNPGGLTVGIPYEIYLQGTFTTSPPHEMILDFLREADSTTI